MKWPMSNVSLFGLIFSKGKGCRKFREIDIKYRIMLAPISPVVERWNRRLDRVTSDEGWRRIFQLHFKSGLEQKFVWFQCRLIQNILGTNERMNMIWPSQYPSPLCTFCHLEPESIIHLESSCTHSDRLWCALEEFLREKAYPNLKITRLMRLFGASQDGPKEPINVIFLITRFFIWYCRCSNTEPQFHTLMQYVRFYLKAIKVSYYLEGKSEAYHNTWSSFVTWIETDDPWIAYILDGYLNSWYNTCLNCKGERYIILCLRIFMHLWLYEPLYLKENLIKRCIIKTLQN